MKRTLLNLFFVLHFGITLLYLCSGMFKLNSIRKATSFYMDPFFEQNWSMFSVPGASNKYIDIQFKAVSKTDHQPVYSGWLDISKPLRDFNNHYYFSISQRLMKYTSGCINDVYTVANQVFDSLEKNPALKNDTLKAAQFMFRALNEESLGYVSLRAYARRVYEQSSMPGKNSCDTLAFALKIVDDAFPVFADRMKPIEIQSNHLYSAFTVDYAKLYK